MSFRVQTVWRKDGCPRITFFDYFISSNSNENTGTGQCLCRQTAPHTPSVLHFRICLFIVIQGIRQILNNVLKNEN